MLILVASRKEAAAVERKEFGYAQVRDVPFELWRNKSHCVLITGIGLVNSALGFVWAIENLEFESVLNIGAAGATCALKNAKNFYGKFFEISNVKCLEPYNFGEYKLAPNGLNLVTSSRPVSTLEEREYAGKFGELVDMEGYALASVAALYNKKLSMLKMVTDFSSDCDISKNITMLRERLADIDGVWI